MGNFYTNYTLRGPSQQAVVAKLAGRSAILRKSSLDDEGYVFEVERHGDLVGTLGISSFAVGAGFRHMFDGELPEGLDEADLVRCKDLVAVQHSQSADDRADKAIPGFYKVSFRTHPGLKKSIPSGWMPGIWTELECPEGDLSVGFRHASAVHREKFKRLGFTELGFKKLRRILNPDYRDNGGINYLDGNRACFGQLIYNKFYIPSHKVEKEGVVIAFTSVFQHEILSCTNNTQTTFDSLPNYKVVRIQSNDVALIYQHFIEHLKQRTDTPLRFTDLQSIQAWFDSNAIETFEDRVHRGLFIRMSDYEVAVARRKLPPGDYGFEN